MSTSASSESGNEEPENSPLTLPSAQPTYTAADHLPQDSDNKETEPLPDAINDAEFDSDEYIPTPVKLKRKGKKRAQDDGEASPSPHPPSSESEPTTEPTLSFRPNQFYGPPSTWLSWTQSERDAAKSLDQDRAQNLTAHLYVAHKIKAHARSVRKAQDKLRKGKSRVATSTDEEMEGGKPFAPPKGWTAWPMAPEDVPRVFHTSGILDDEDPSTIKGPQDWRPSAELEACLIAATKRTARERWEGREWEGGHDDEQVSVDMARKRNATMQPGRDSSPPPMMFSSQPITQPALHSSPESNPLPPFSHHKSSKPSQTGARSHSHSPPRSPSHFLPPSASLKPVPLADDDQARTLLLPSTRRIVAKLDDLLMGLHRTRQAYATKRSARTGGQTELLTETETEAEMSMSRSRGRSRSGKRKRSASARGRKRIRRASSHAEIEVSDVEQRTENEEIPRSSDSASKARSQRSKSRNHHPRTPKESISRLGLRDWSDVLGLAALTGWDQDVIARAGKRCSQLFGEDMGFRTFLGAGSGGVDGGRDGIEQWWASGRGAMKPDREEEDDSEDVDEDTGDEGSDEVTTEPEDRVMDAAA